MTAADALGPDGLESFLDAWKKSVAAPASAGSIQRTPAILSIRPEDCPEPFWHETHRYCPVCAWVEAPDSSTEPEFREQLPAQAKALDFVRERWPSTVDPIWRAAKLCEEAGEALGAVIKSEQGISGKTTVDVAIETAQVVICALGLAEACGFDLLSEVWREWDICHERTWE